MTGIIRQLLDFARPRRSQKSRVDVAALARQTVALLDAMARKRGVALSFVPNDLDPMATVDEGQIQQALTNLVVNAIHATPQGGAVNVGFDREPARHPAGSTTSACLRLYVTDTGEGMDDETKARVFEPFFTTKGVGEGTGLGLSVTHGIMNEHAGWIGVESAPRRGSTFSLYLPIEGAVNA